MLSLMTTYEVNDDGDAADVDVRSIMELDAAGCGSWYNGASCGRGTRGWRESVDASRNVFVCCMLLATTAAKLYCCCYISYLQLLTLIK